MNISKAFIPMAGYGTRRLPVTKALEKCMLPIGNRPIVDYVVGDCLKAGVTDIIFVVGEQFNQLQTYYGRNMLLEEYLKDKGKTKELEEIIDLSEKATFHYVVQDQHQPYGTAVPVALCADLVNDDEQVGAHGRRLYLQCRR
ncbi:MAG: sugar phosphate nucleotidyltransferase [Candidatus Saccharimonadales bacterium]